MFRELKRDYLLLSTLLLLFVVAILNPALITKYPYYVDWHTILLLSSLFLITTAIKDSYYFDILARRLISKYENERILAVSLVLVAFFLSMLITNDVALLILVPLTLSLQKLIQQDIRKIIIFEALAVNTGSALTPIGNPQNIYLWRLWNVGFLDFIIHLLPLVIIMLLLLLLFLSFIFPSRKIHKIESAEAKNEDKRLAFASLTLLLFLVASMELGVQIYLIPIIFLFYLIYRPRTYMHVDWPLILVFILFLMEFNALAHMPFIFHFFSHNLSPKDTYLYSALFSQVMSNVPSAIFFANFSNHYKALVYGVSVGGNGTAIASLANLIALRFVRDRKIWISFHKYSVLYFILSFTIIYIILFSH